MIYGLYYKINVPTKLAVTLYCMNVVLERNEGRLLFFKPLTTKGYEEFLKKRKCKPKT